jgi:organic radical activating enzyme
MRVSELFYSLQGEGARAGEPSLFVRLSGCSAKFACAAAGVACDTEFESGQDLSRDDLADLLRNMSPDCRWIVWTGGEPTDQLTGEDVAFFARLGYLQAIETSGVRPVPPGLDWVTVSPKVAEHVLAKHFPEGVSELKYVRHAGQAIPEPQVQAVYYCLSPHSDGLTLNVDNMRACIALCLANPKWRLSLQQHKLWQIR